MSRDLLSFSLRQCKICRRPNPKTIDQAGIATFQVINGGAAVYPSLTSVMYTEDTKVWVSTRFPIDSFDFEAPGASISVSGNAALKLADGSRRLLQGDVGDGVPDIG